MKITSIVGYFHKEYEVDAQGNRTSVVAFTDEFHHTTGRPEFDHDPRAIKAREAAEGDRNAGVAHELAYIGIPGFEALLQEWKRTLSGEGFDGPIKVQRSRICAIFPLLLVLT